MALRLPPGNLFGETLQSCQVSGFKLSERSYPPCFETPRHSHNWPLFCLVIDGSYTETYGAKTRSCCPYTLLYHPPSELHAEHFHNSGGRSFIIEIDPDWLNRLRGQAIVADDSADFYGGILGVLGQRLYKEFQAMDNLSPLVIEGLMLEIVGEASRHTKLPSTLRPPHWLTQAHDLLRDSFTKHLTLDEIAKVVGVHPVHLAQAFHKYYRCTIGEFIRQLRIEYACNQLATTNASLVEIAMAAGFADQSHFTRTFKRYTGVPPSQYRSIFRQP